MSRQVYITEPSYSPNFRFSLRAILIAFVVVAPILWLVVTVANHSAKRSAETAARTKAIWESLNRTVEEAEKVRMRLGRTPIDKNELEVLMGHPLTVVVNPHLTSPIYYERNSDGSYNLVFSVAWLEGFSGDFLMFQSNNPKAGWAVHYD